MFGPEAVISRVGELPSREVPYEVAQNEIARIRQGLSVDPSYAAQVEEGRFERGMMLPTRTVTVGEVTYQEDVDRQKAPFLQDWQERVDEAVTITRISTEGRRSAKLRAASLKSPSNHPYSFGEAFVSLGGGDPLVGQEAIDAIPRAFPELFSPTAS